jgi:type III secretory pathway component EscR
MLAMRILATIFIGISVITGLIKNYESINEVCPIIIIDTYSTLWRAFIIVTIWVI